MKTFPEYLTNKDFEDKLALMSSLDGAYHLVYMDMIDRLPSFLAERAEQLKRDYSNGATHAQLVLNTLIRRYGIEDAPMNHPASLVQSIVYLAEVLGAELPEKNRFLDTIVKELAEHILNNPSFKKLVAWGIAQELES